MQTSRKLISSQFTMKTLSVCLLLLVIALISTIFFNVSLGTLLIAAFVLACPLLHFWIMKGSGHKHL